ncbi:DUF2523 domain-containing protein [Dechloromonas sp. XY25]|uniref:DUF2523 domain-containing protein n=1 Tax=Dechloromonas hankyongensis TaxID=2908002 RepID=A0ABS9K3F5_9RHOO|nr:DUF2523 family protein [Dechloromonas hankyongensis]MCG2577595.1 DUF2523 domain-containing protein [Dechloromonas hankyongensis]
MFEFLQSISDFFQTGIYTFFQDAATYLITTLLIWWIKAKIMGLEFAWGVAQGILQGFQVSQKISAAFSMLPAEVLGTVNFFRFPEAVNLILAGGATRWVIKFIPGL